LYCDLADGQVCIFEVLQNNTNVVGVVIPANVQKSYKLDHQVDVHVLQKVRESILYKCCQ